MKILILLAMAIFSAVLGGCAGNVEVIKSMSTNTRQDVFQEPSATTPIPPGYADLHIVSSLKTHLPGIYSYNDVHGSPEYKLLVNIDGQALQLVGSLREERRDQHSLRDPEEGHGIRYLFQKELRLKSGMHRIFISLPFDEVVAEREITLANGSSNTLVLEPVYSLARDKRRIGFYTTTSFKEGIKGFWVNFNGKPL
ncbi:MAG: hypothetical protein WA140_07175 [Geobacteraceae bacterium]